MAADAEDIARPATSAAVAPDLRLTGVSVVIPAYNEELVIGSVIIKAKQYADLVIVVDDGSADRTSEVAKLAGADVIRLDRNTGKPYAILLGLRHARDRGCMVAVVLDGNGEHDPREIPRIIGAVLSGAADLVIGSRYLNSSQQLYPHQKFYQMKLRSGVTITDPVSSFKAFNKKALDNLDFKSDGIRFNRDLISHFDASGLRIKEVPLTYTKTNNNFSIWGRSIKVLAAMPAYNEEKYIAKTIIGTKKYVDQVLIVDDGSTDATREIAEDLGAIVVHHEKNSGYGAALQTIFAKARDLHVDALVILDADGQHDPRDVARLLEALATCDADVIIGSRFVKGNGNHIPGYRKVGMKVLDSATKIAGGAKVNDSQSGFRAYGKRAIDVIYPNGDGMSAGSEILIQISDHNLRIAEVPINVRYDIEDTSTQNPVKHGLSVLSNIIGLISYRRPLPAFGIPGCILIVSGFLAELWVLAELRTTGVFHDVLAIGSAFVMVLGMILIITGLILNYLVIFVNKQNKKTDTNN
jgi:glycosyltransferase involved in cell wall biosynthesis